MQSPSTQRGKAARAYGADRLRNKTARKAIIHAIGRDFNLTPIIAEAYFSQVATYFDQHADVSLATGQICYEAVSAAEPASKHIALAARVSVRLTLFGAQVDLTILVEHGLAGLRRHRILRMTREAIDQGALLSYEDLAVILIIDLYLKGYQFTEIELKTNHSETSVRRYLKDFIQVVALQHQNFSIAQIRQVTGFSERLTGEYIELFSHYDTQKNDRLALLLGPATPKKGAQKEVTS